ncbi:MAG TPA: hypothetical protein VK181_23075, partial [Rhizobium sp.]|nr:hypothetical protein [Rhizobium sp.]
AGPRLPPRRQMLPILRQCARIGVRRPSLSWRRLPPAMIPQSPSLSAKILAAVFGFALMVAVPLLTGYYAAQAHAADVAPASATAHR